MDYKKSGVDIEAGEKAVESIKNIVKKTYSRNVLSDLGAFGGLYHLDLSLWKDPVMVSSCDGVGTKIIVAHKAKKYDTIGEDLVNHCVNDIFVQGAKPQFFLDYIGLGRMNNDFIKEIIAGMSKACIENDLALIGGEMAEMPDIYQNNDFDLVGTIVGLVEKSDLITGKSIKEDDILIGFPSTGLHTNGYSLARKIVFDKLGLDVDSYVKDLNATVKDALLQTHKSYYPVLKKWSNPAMIHGMAHITGGGLKGNIKRIIPAGLTANIHCNTWTIPPLFKWLVKKGELSINEAFCAFNMGIGYVVITSKEKADQILHETEGFIIGNMTRNSHNESVIINYGQ